MCVMNQLRYHRNLRTAKKSRAEDELRKALARKAEPKPGEEPAAQDAVTLIKALHRRGGSRLRLR